MNPPNPALSLPIVNPTPMACEAVWQTLSPLQRAQVRRLMGNLCCQIAQQLTCPPSPDTFTQLELPLSGVRYEHH